MELSEEEKAMQELMAMKPQELQLVPHDMVKWVCQGKGCCNGTKIMDFGTHPVYYHPRKNIGWFNICEWYWMCTKHKKIFTALIKNHPVEKVEIKLFDRHKKKIPQIGK